MSDFIVSVDTDKCIGCGLCCEDCPSKILKLLSDKANVTSQQCIKCGHCVAICPVNAFRISGYDSSEVKELGETNITLNTDELSNHLMFRRSTRKYKCKEIEKEKVERIIEAGRYTPTGSNSQNVRYIVVKKEISWLEEETLKGYKRKIKLATLLKHFKALPYDIDKYKPEPGFLFHGAPLLILFVSENNVNAALAAMSAELMAESLGLGTLYVGLFTRPANRNKKIRSFLGLTKKENIVAALAMGYPGIQYKRTAPRKKAEIKWL